MIPSIATVSESANARIALAPKPRLRLTGLRDATWLKVPLLEAGQCQDIVDRIDRLSPRWDRHDADRPFFTLGTASYLEAAQSNEQYYRKITETNPLLAVEFGELLSLLCEKMQAALGVTCRLSWRQGLPGFHIFGAHEDYLQPMASIHTDLQYELLDWSRTERDAAACDFDKVLSFTLPLQLPHSGGGLHVWPDAGPGQRYSALFLDREEFMNEHPPELMDYKCGELVIHDGRTLHQIAPLPRLDYDDRRISLQGHAVMIRGEYHLYW